jgi:predicted MarR family transcription regulator
MNDIVNVSAIRGGTKSSRRKLVAYSLRKLLKWSIFTKDFQSKYLEGRQILTTGKSSYKKYRFKFIKL